MTRLFVAAWPSPEVRQRLTDLAGPEHDEVRTVPPENWHVTLRFLGDADPDVVAQRLAGTDLPSVHVAYGPSTVSLDRRQIVVPVAGADPLAAAVTAATGDLGQARRRRFVGHLTVARLGRRAGAAAGASWIGLPIHAEQTVDAVALVASELRPEGSRYRTLRTFAANPGPSRP